MAKDILEKQFEQIRQGIAEKTGKEAFLDYTVDEFGAYQVTIKVKGVSDIERVTIKEDLRELVQAGNDCRWGEDEKGNGRITIREDASEGNTP